MGLPEIPTYESLGELLAAYRCGLDPLADLVDEAKSAARVCDDEQDEAGVSAALTLARDLEDLGVELRQYAAAMEAAMSFDLDSSDPEIAQVREMAKQPVAQEEGAKGWRAVIGYLVVRSEIDPTDGGQTTADGLVGLRSGHVISPGIYPLIHEIDGSTQRQSIEITYMTSGTGGELGTFTRTVATAADLPQVYVPGIECFDGNLFLCDGVRVIYVARYRDSGVPKVLHTIQFLTQTG